MMDDDGQDENGLVDRETRRVDERDVVRVKPTQLAALVQQPSNERHKPRIQIARLDARRPQQQPRGKITALKRGDSKMNKSPRTIGTAAVIKSSLRPWPKLKYPRAHARSNSGVEQLHLASLNLEQRSHKLRDRIRREELPQLVHLSKSSCDTEANG